MISLAFLAGVLAAFNPCGFVLLPAYLTSVVAAESDGPSSTWLFIARALRFSAGMAIGFITVFGGFALFLTSISGAIEKLLPIVTILMGLVIIGLGIALVLNKTILLRKLANPNIAPTNGWLSQIGYGISFALASISCTVGPFLAITASAISKHNLWSIFTLFLSYSLGMAGVVLLLALLVASAQVSAINRLKKSQGRIAQFSGLLLILVGLYEIWYGWYEIRILHDATASDPVITTVIKLQSHVTQWIASIGTTSLVAVLTVPIIALLFAGVKRRSRKESSS